MARLTLFQAAVVWHPNLNDEEEKTKDSVLLVEPYFTMEKDDKTLAYKIVRKLDEKYIDQMNQIEIIIRPF